ncbi:MAG: hypothetical protein CMK09_16990 [Ponticaulis sp.]|nr:hypothetical protein [Ponticaulis sp.]|tara:strand:+ start:11263 stop:12723 length:1461 start_codon:yes stop_codon:yes gene_type:complete
MSFDRRTVLDLVLAPLGVLAYGFLCWYAVYVGPTSADKLETRFGEGAQAALSAPEFDWARVEMDGQVATLVGLAPTEELKSRALRRVALSSGRGGYLHGGVTRVVDQTDLIPPVGRYEFRAEKIGDRLKLSGFLPGPDARLRIEDWFAEQPDVVMAPIMDLAYRDGVPEGDWLGMLELGLAQLRRLTDGEFTIVNRRAVLKGEVRDSAIRQDITLRMARPPSGFSTDVEIIGTAVWSARLSGDLLRLNGQMPNARDRTRIEQLADRLFDGEIINDSGVGLMPEDDWVDAIEEALPNFLKFRDGALIFMGDQILIDGHATASVLDYLREDLVRSGGGVDIIQRAEATPLDLAAFEELPADSPPSRDVCQSALDEALGLSPINFEYARDELTRDSGPVLDGLLSVFQTCSHLVFEIEAATHARGRRIALQNLTSDRQQAFSSYFIAHGVPIDQLELPEIITTNSGVAWAGNLDTDRQISVRLRELEDD